MRGRQQLSQSVEGAIERTWHCILQRFMQVTYRGSSTPYIPLFLEDTSPTLEPAELDVCSASLATSLLARRKGLNAVEQAMLQDLLRFLLAVRSGDGSWPSLVNPDDTAGVTELEGVLNEVYWAFRALLDAGIPNPKGNVAGLPVGKQLAVVGDAIEWLDANKVRHAWWYTGTSRAEDRGTLTPAVLPTAHVIIVLDQAVSALQKFSSEADPAIVNDENRRTAAVIRDKASQLYQEAIDWLRNLQNTDGGYGAQAGGRSSVTNTAIAVSALCTDPSPATAHARRESLFYLLGRNTKGHSSVAEWELFEQYDQIRSFGGTGVCIPRRRQIRHEKTLEPTVIQALVAAASRKLQPGDRTLYESLGPMKKWQFRRRLGATLRALLGRQLRSGSLAGAFRGHRQTPLEFPFYYAVESVLALDAIRMHIELASRFLSRWQWIAVGGVVCLGVAMYAIVRALSDDARTAVLTGIGVLVIGWIGTAIWKGLTKE